MTVVIAILGARFLLMVIFDFLNQLSKNAAYQYQLAAA
jgi:hypothetical protein